MATNVDSFPKSFWKIVKTSTCIFCLVGFVLNSLAIFENFVEGKTLTSNELQKNDRLLLPSITICGISGFKEEMDEYSDLDFESYLNKTIDLEDILWDAVVDKTYFTVTEMLEDKTLWKISTTYSQYKGRCHTIQYTKGVKISKLYFEILV